MTNWIACPHCSLRHRRRRDDVCPRCKEPLGADVAAAASPAPGFSSAALVILPFAGAGQPEAAAPFLPEVYDDRPLPRSKLEREGADAEDPIDSGWFALAGGLFVLWFAYSLNGDFNELATGARESVRVWWVIAWLYQHVGPEVTVALVGLVGALLTWRGWRRLG